MYDANYCVIMEHAKISVTVIVAIATKVIPVVIARSKLTNVIRRRVKTELRVGISSVVIAASVPSASKVKIAN